MSGLSPAAAGTHANHVRQAAIRPSLAARSTPARRPGRLRRKSLPHGPEDVPGEEYPRKPMIFVDLFQGRSGHRPWIDLGIGMAFGAGIDRGQTAGFGRAAMWRTS